MLSHTRTHTYRGRECESEDNRGKERVREEQLKKVERWEGERIGVVLLEELEVYVCNFQLFAFDFKSTTETLLNTTKDTEWNGCMKLKSTETTRHSKPLHP